MKAASLRDLLSAQREPLVERLAARLEAEAAIPEARRRAAELLDGLLAALARLEPQPAGTAASRAGAVPDADPVLRAVREYGVLGEAVLDAAERAGVDLAARDHRVLHGAWMAGLAGAARARLGQRDAEARRASAEHIAFVAHELRSPLAAARIALAALRRHPVEAPETLIGSLERSLLRLGGLVEGLLRMQLVEHRTEPRRQRMDLGGLIEEICAAGTSEADARGVRITAEVETDLAFDADPDLLRSALANLLENAVRSSRAGGAVRVRGRRGGEGVWVEVADECGGLAPELADELFRPFVRGHGDGRGFGLGLAIAKRAIEAHGGTVRVEPRAGAGCAFHVRLPAAGGGGGMG
jgi:signal transduction histidine kinase